MPDTTEAAMHSFMINEDERVELIRLLEQVLGETRVETHRTHSPEFRERVMGEQALLRGLLDRFHTLRVYE